MNVHKSKIYSKVKELKVYALGFIEEPADFCDIIDKDGNHVCCIVSMTSEDARNEITEKKIKNECVIWDKEGFPDIYVKNKLIDLKAIRKGIRLLQQDKHNKFDYDLSIERVPLFTKRLATGNDTHYPSDDIWLPFDKKKLELTRELFNKKFG